MSPRETRFLRALIDSGVLSFKAAAKLEEYRQSCAEAGVEKPVWDLAVENGMITPEQSAEALREADAEAEGPGSEAAAARQVLGGYELISKLGQGGMGAVYKARQATLDRLVALKILPQSLARNQEFIGRFLREARVAGKLSHPNIVAGIDAGFADGYYYFAMEYVDGRNLADRLRLEGPLAEAEALEVGRQVAEALDYAHRSGLVHRDVKPENILVAADGQAKLCDLGLARGPAEDMRLTQAGYAVGTPHYIAPEQIRGQNPDGRADIYSLGCTLFHLVAGQPPFPGDNSLVIMQKHLNEAPPHLSEVRHGTSRALEAVVEKMMAKAPEARYQSAGEAAEDLTKAARAGVPVALTQAMVKRRRPERSSTGTTRPVEPRPAPATDATVPMSSLSQLRRNWPLLAAAGGLFLAAALAAFLWGVKSGQPPTGSRTGPNAPPVAEDPLKKLADKFEAAQAYEAEHPKSYAQIVKFYGEIAEGSAGSPLEAKARQAIAAVQKRQQEDQSAERLKALAEDLEKIRQFEAANPEKYQEILERYARFAAGALGTEYEAKAGTLAEAVKKRRAGKAIAQLGELRGQVGRAVAAGDFAAALAAIEAFPRAYAPDAERDLGQLREGVLASGRARWSEMLAGARALSREGKFDEAAAALAKGRALGLPGLDGEVRSALAEVDQARKAAEAARVAQAEKDYGGFSEELSALLARRDYAGARARGAKLAGRLTPELEARLQADLAFAADAERFLSRLRSDLRKLERGAIALPTPMGKGYFLGYDPARDVMELKVGQGASSVTFPAELAKIDGADLVSAARQGAGGELAARAAREAAAFLLSAGKPAGVKELLEGARKGGEDVSDLAARLARLERGTSEVDAEALLTGFDKSFRERDWPTAVATGARLLKDYAATEAVRKRADLAGLVEQARRAGSPLIEYSLTLQDGLKIGSAVYAGTRDTYIGGEKRAESLNFGGEKALKTIEPKFRGLIRFAIFDFEGGPVPASAEIAAAKLKLYKERAYLAHVAAHEVLRDWSEKEVVWADASRKDKWAEPGCGAIGKDRSREPVASGEVDYAAGQWLELDVTASLRRWSARQLANHGWLLIDAHPKDSQNYREWCSREYAADPALRPKLEITYRK